jgi:Carbohydrate family 9 binding domain-like
MWWIAINRLLQGRDLMYAPVFLVCSLLQPAPPAADMKELHVRFTDDFQVSGDGSASAWTKAAWEPLTRRTPAGLPYETRVKVLYSTKGLYVLMDATDKKITATFKDDFENLWTEDVFEVFFWPDERDPVYFEYEISPLNRELPILIPNLGGKFLGWRPWHYDGARKIRKATTAVGGQLVSGGKIDGWKAEIFIPYELLTPLRNVPPKAGTRWRANFYRVDYDDGNTTRWTWSDVGSDFHKFKKFGTVVFD